METLFWIKEVKDFNDHTILEIKDLHIVDTPEAKRAVYEYLMRFARSEDKKKGILYTNDKIIFLRSMENPPLAYKNYFLKINPKIKRWFEENFTKEQLSLLEKPNKKTRELLESNMENYLDLLSDKLNKREEIEIEHEKEGFLKHMEISLQIAKKVIIKNLEEAILILREYEIDEEIIDKISNNISSINESEFKLMAGIMELGDTISSSPSLTSGSNQPTFPYKNVFNKLTKNLGDTKIPSLWLITLAQDKKLKDFIFKEREKVRYIFNNGTNEEFQKEVVKFNIKLIEKLKTERKYLTRLARHFNSKAMIETTIHELLHSLCFTDSIVHPATRVIGKHYLGISLSTHRYSYPKLTLNFEIILQQYHARGGRIKSDLALVNIALALKDLDKFKEFLEQDLR